MKGSYKKLSQLLMHKRGFGPGPVRPQDFQALEERFFDFFSDFSEDVPDSKSILP